jgi:hypothetical protein
VGRQFLKGAGLLIALYLVVAYSTGFGRSLTAAGNVGVRGVKAFQGRG